MRKLSNKLLTMFMAGIIAAATIPGISLFGTEVSVYAQESQTEDTSWYNSEATEYTLMNAGQLKGLAKLVNDGTESFRGKTVILGNDIDLNSEEWTPIGTYPNNGFEGKFDGNGKTVSNFKIDTTYSAEPGDWGLTYSKEMDGLFGFAGIYPSSLEDTIASDEIPEIKNLNLSNINIKVSGPDEQSNNTRTDCGVGGLVGYGQNLKINNCTIDNSIIESQTKNVGGLVGSLQSGIIDNCSTGDNLKVTSNGLGYSGLVCGTIEYKSTSNKYQVPSKISNIHVAGIIQGSNNTGGVCGYYVDIRSSAEYESIEKIKVEKNTTVKGSGMRTGGLFGYCNRSMKNVINYGTVTGSGDFTSGIAIISGVSNSSTDIYLNNCINYGTVSGTNHVSGLVTHYKYGSSFKNLILKNCASIGEISGSEYLDIFATGTQTGLESTKISDSFYLNNEAINLNNDYTYENVYYNLKSESNLGTEIEGIILQTTTQFKNRTVVDALNKGKEEIIWYQNVDYPSIAFEMDLIEKIDSVDSMVLEIGKKGTLLVTVKPDNATNPSLLFASDDEKVATVDENGVITPVEKGATEIEVKAVDSGLIKKVKVTVKQPEPAKESEKPSAPVANENTAVTGTTVTVGTNNYIITDDTTVEYSGTTNKKATKISIPATVKIGNKTYKVTSVSANALKGNKNIKSVTIGSNVTSIGKNAFANCKKLTSVVIGKNVKTIGSKAFYGCNKLKKIIVKSTKLKKVGSKAFKGIYKKAVIKVPSKKLKSYTKLLKGKGQKKTVIIKK